LSSYDLDDGSEEGHVLVRRPSVLGSDDASSGDLSDEVRIFMREQIDEYEQLEILLLLHGDRRSKWNATSVSEQLRVPREISQAALELLQTRHLVTAVKEGDAVWYQCTCGDTKVERTLDSLARAYADDRLAVMQVMNANAIERVRTAAIRTFADAFVLRSKPK
jgi:hypothetical protein